MDNQGSTDAENKKSAITFTRRDVETDEQQRGLLQDHSSDEDSPNRRSTGGRYLSLSPSRTGIFADV